MNFTVCSLTKGKVQDAILYNSIKNLNIDYDIEHKNTTKGIGTFLNEKIEEYGGKKDALIFIHDDVEIVSTDLEYQLAEAFKKFDIVGVAGCINPKILDKNLWHWMAQTKENLRGMAGHPCGLPESFFITSFGPTPSRVAIIDGVFMAFKLDKILETNTRFDEQFKFHHYDIDFSLTCNKNNLKIGVWPILLNHQSPGLKEFDSNFNSSNQKFINKWKNI